MTKIDEFLLQWRDARDGLIKEVERIPEDKLDFRISAGARSALEILYHVIESERMLTDEICCDESDLRRMFARSPDTEIKVVTTKDAMVGLLRTSLASSSEKITQFGEEKLDRPITRFDGRQVSKMSMLHFTLSHEMYHRGQLTAYQRALGIEPALTEQFRRLTSPNQ